MLPRAFTDCLGRSLGDLSMGGAQFVRLRRVFFKAAFFDLTFSARLASVLGTPSDYPRGKRLCSKRYSSPNWR